MSENPKDKVGRTKVPFHVIPPQVLAEVALGLFEGGRKYGEYNYRAATVAISVYYDAALRHLTAFYEGEDIDPDSGLHHVSKAITTLTVLRDALLNNKFLDDRPPKPTNAEWMKEANAKAAAIVDKYPNPVPPFTDTMKGT